jgi:Leucine-rich repeat (LRR) protein
VVALTACGAAPDGSAVSATETVSSSSLAVLTAPKLTSFSPAKAIQGATITINGVGFVNGASVAFNGSPAATVTFVSSSRLKAVVPSGATSGAISVTVPAGAAESATPFAVLPTVASVEPLHAFAGDFVTITGTGLMGATGVKFGSLTALFSVQSDTAISAAVPAGFASGKITVVTPAGNAATTTTVLALPLVGSFSPTQGLVGSSVEVLGEGFAQASAVKLGSKVATFSVVDDTLLRMVVPAGVSSGKITVETPRGSRVSTGTFAVILKPTVSSFSPGAAELPAIVTVNGTNFLAVSAVKVGAVSVPFELVTAKQLRATLPLGTPNGKLSVVNPAGTGLSAGTFTALPCSDADADGACDRDDRCPGFDDRVDSDSDGTADGCDICPSAATAGQSCGTGLACNSAGACADAECNENTTGPGVLRGSAVIDGTDTQGDLALLAGIWCVTGDVTVNHALLTDLSGLSSLLEVGGNLGIGTSPPGCPWYQCGLGNGSLRSLHGLENLRRVGGDLEVLDQAPDPGIIDLTGLSGLRRAGRLLLQSPLLLTDLHGLENLTTLGWLDIAGANQLTSLNGLQNLTSVERATFNGLPLLTDLSALSKLTSVDDLTITQTGIASLHGLENLTTARQIGVGGNPNLTSIDALSGLTSLQSLALHGAGITSVAAFANVHDLGWLYLDGLGITTLDGLAGLASPARVEVVNCPHLTSIAALGSAPVSLLNLSVNESLLDCGAVVPTADAEVTVASCYALTSLGCLSQATALRSLRLEGNYALPNLDALSNLTRVDYRFAISGGNVQTLAPLRNLTTTYDFVVASTSISDLHGLEGLAEVGGLSLYYNPGLRSLHELTSLTQLTYADVQYNWNLSQCEVDWLDAQTGDAVIYSGGNGEACVP